MNKIKFLKKLWGAATAIRTTLATKVNLTTVYTVGIIMGNNFNIGMMTPTSNMRYRASQVKVNKAYRIISNINNFKRNLQGEKVTMQQLLADHSLLLLLLVLPIEVAKVKVTLEELVQACNFKFPITVQETHTCITNKSRKKMSRYSRWTFILL